MAPSSPNPSPFDPCRAFRFRIRLDGACVAAFQRVDVLGRSIEAAAGGAHSGPGAPRSAPGQTRFAPVTLERGVTLDPAFDAWAQNAWTSTLEDVRGDIRVEVCDAAGQLETAYVVHQCWPSQYVSLRGLGAGTETTAIQTLVLQNEGWARDPGATASA